MKTATIILAAPRAGGSALALALSARGFKAPRPDNAITDLNDAILLSLGARWQQPGPWLLDGAPLSAARAYVDEQVCARWRTAAIAALENCYGGAERIVLHDPRVSLFLPLWRAALAARGYAPRHVLLYRNPLDVAASLGTLDPGIAARPAFNLWQHYVLAALNAVRDADAMVAFESLTADPHPVVERVLAGEGGSVASGVVGMRVGAPASSEAVDASPLIAEQIKKTWRLLRTWDETPPPKRRQQIRRLTQRYDDSLLLHGPLIPLDAAPAPAVTGRAAPELPAPFLILHYHLFKNAGSSIDEMLKRNFGVRWASHEFNRGEDVAAFLAMRPELQALSSHTMQFPLPQLDGRRVLPIVFFRHPIDRLRSAYDFERKQIADTFGARLAKRENFAGYMRALLALPAGGQARNFQAHRLARNEPADLGTVRARGLRALDALPFIGLVEAYEASLVALEGLVRPAIPSFAVLSVHKNASSGRTDALPERLETIRREIGDTFFGEICAANDDDLALYAVMARRYRVE